jgi:catechol 2,3-dioxygenase-like lactoylglutathione lyase family enzyme
MHVEAIDHVNIITTELEATASFFADMLGLERRDGPPPLTPANAQWMFDAGGRAVIHINTGDAPRAYDRDTTAGPTTGALHHVALRCAGYAAMVARLEAKAIDHRINRVDAIGLRQIFVSEPNGVLLELNYFGD